MNYTRRVHTMTHGLNADCSQFPSLFDNFLAIKEVENICHMGLQENFQMRHHNYYLYDIRYNKWKDMSVYSE